MAAGYICIFQTDEEYEEYKNSKNINALNIEFITEPDIKRSKLSGDRSFYIVYSPEKLKLRPRDSQISNLRLKLNLSEKIEAMIGLLSSFVSRKLSIENSTLISNRRKDEAIHIDILSKHFYDTIKIKKNQEIAYIFLINKKSHDKLVTVYSNYTPENQN